ncbi:MAG: response regulator transcription factor [Acidobacteria bacterium]|nr:response regulator transcription factor [Acidobacteriota bacterium]
MSDTVSILIVDDHEIVREGLRTLLGEVDDLQVVGEAGSGRQALDRAAALDPDVILMDLVMPQMGGIEAIAKLKEQGSRAGILVLSSFIEDDLVRQAVEAGALGYLLKDASKGDLIRAIRGAKEGRPSLHPDAQRILMQRVQAPPQRSPIDELTPREKNVLELIARGRSNKQIASSLHLSEGTVKGYVSAILGKLAVDDRTQAALLAVREGFVPDP